MPSEGGRGTEPTSVSLLHTGQMEHVVMPLGMPWRRIHFLIYLKSPGTRDGEPQQSLLIVDSLGLYATNFTATLGSLKPPPHSNHARDHVKKPCLSPQPKKTEASDALQKQDA